MEETIREIIRKVRPDIDFAAVPGSADFDNAGLDSLDHASILFEVQESFGVTVPDEMVDRLKTIDGIVRYLVDQRG